MRFAAAAAALAAVLVCGLVAAVGGSAPRRPDSYTHLDQDWGELRKRCAAREAGCGTGAALENCVRR